MGLPVGLTGGVHAECCGVRRHDCERGLLRLQQSLCELRLAHPGPDPRKPVLLACVASKLMPVQAKRPVCCRTKPYCPAVHCLLPALLNMKRAIAAVPKAALPH